MARLQKESQQERIKLSSHKTRTGLRLSLQHERKMISLKAGQLACVLRERAARVQRARVFVCGRWPQRSLTGPQSRV